MTYIENINDAWLEQVPLVNAGLVREGRGQEHSIYEQSRLISIRVCDSSSAIKLTYERTASAMNR